MQCQLKSTPPFWSEECSREDQILHTKISTKAQKHIWWKIQNNSLNQFFKECNEDGRKEEHKLEKLEWNRDTDLLLICILKLENLTITSKEPRLSHNNNLKSILLARHSETSFVFRESTVQLQATSV